MSTKDLFNKSNKVLTKSQVEKIKNDLESEELVRDVIKSNNKFRSHLDYSEPANFCFYGSAERYYEDSFNRIYQTYPYDGSQSEIEKWIDESSELDLWLLDNVYPKSTGHIKLASSQSVIVKGGPNNQPGVTPGEAEELSKQFPVKQGNSNIWDTSIYRNSNLYIDGALGNTVEFWAKLDGSYAGTFVPFNISNDAQSVLLLARFRTTDGLLILTYKDDSGVTSTANTYIVDLISTNWNHVSFSFINEDSQVKFEVRKNGTLVFEQETGTAIGSVSQDAMRLNINGTSNGVFSADGLFIDEFRFWKRKRTEEEIGRYWHTHIHGGTNTDDNKYNTENRKVDIGVYYKFNEGITGDDSIDATVLDYSGRISNGSIMNYTPQARNTASAFDESGLVNNLEEKTPTVYASNPDFKEKLEEYKNKGSAYDYLNNSSMYHTMPSWIIDEDAENGENIKELSQVLSSYFDEAHTQIKELVDLKKTDYYSLTENTKKPSYLVRQSLESLGMPVPDLFVEASAFEEILSRGEQEKFEQKLYDIKSTIYQNIYNNLSYIYKSKGTEKAFRNLIRCFGVDDELIKINLYSDKADYTLSDTRRTTSLKKKFVDFNNDASSSAVVYTKANAAEPATTSYIRGMGAETASISFTFETELIFPKNKPPNHPEYFFSNSLEEHIAYLGEYDSATSSYTPNQIFDLKAVKENGNVLSKNIKFVLNIGGQTLETQYFKDVYDNSRWNIAVRLKPLSEINFPVGSGIAPDYRAELYCVKYAAGIIEEEELVASAVISLVTAQNYMQQNKFLSIGALRLAGDPESITLENDTRLRMSSTLFWYDDVSNEEIRAHASDPSNYGRLHPSEDAYMFETAFNDGTNQAIQVPRRDTLALHWDFSEVSTTDASGEFIVHDVSHSVPSISSRYGWFTDLVGHQITGRGKYFAPNDTQVVNREFLHAAKHRTPENINSEDLVEIRTFDDEIFTKDASPVTHFFAVEKSMYQVINDDIINLFATIVEFNDLIGQPVNRYRMEYKSLEKFRQRYFEKVKNVPSLEKYVGYYKWLDSSIGIMLQQLIPVSSNFSADMRTMVESHVLERNKYWSKFPTLEMSSEPPLGIVRGINELAYNWKDGSRPYAGETIEDDKFLWGDQRVQGDDLLVTTGTPAVDENRETLRRIATRKTQGNTKVVERNGVFVEEDKPVLRESPIAPGTPGQTYSGQAYVTRALSRPYRLNLDISDTIHGGVNFSPTTKDPNAFVRASTRFIPGVNTIGVDIDSGDNPTTYEEWKKLYKVKRTTTITISDTETNLTEYLSGDFSYPHYGAGFKDASPHVTGQHSDSYGDNAEIPMQGPFTETHVGGNQHRHVDFTVQADRPELYVNVVGTLKHPHEENLSNTLARRTRDEVAKRPVNIRNIKTGVSRTLGNYARDYEIVQTSGRTQNNRYFVENEGVAQSEVNSPFVSGTTEFALPDRGRSEHIFTERFSAPGDPLTLSRGYLDTAAEEYSAYNSMNYRNLEEREEQKHRLYTHSGIHEGSQGYEDVITGIPSIHKVNRNRNIRPTNIQHDNAYVNHQIPRSSLQYTFSHGTIYEPVDISSFASTGAGSVPVTWSTNESDERVVSFNTSASGISVPDDSSIDFGSSDFTISIFLKDVSPSTKMIYEKTGYLLYTVSNMVRAAIEDSSGNTITLESSALGTDWNHIVIRYDQSAVGDKFKIFVNGSEDYNIFSTSGVYSLPMRSDSSPLVVGNDITLGLGFGGFLRDMVVLKEALSGAEILEMYEERNPAIHSKYNNFKAWWRLGGPLDAVSGPDSIKNEFGTVHGTPTGTIEFHNVTPIPGPDQTMNGPRVRSHSQDSGDKVFSMIGSYKDHYSEITDPPIQSGMYRWISPITSWEKPIHLSFEVYEGRPGGEYGLTDSPEVADSENLWLQYKIGVSGSWSTIYEIEPESPSPITNRIYEKTIYEGQDSSNRLYLRWISRGPAGDTGQDAGTLDHDHWGITNILVEELPASKYYEELEIQKGTVNSEASYADYQGAGWRFLRNVEKPQVARQRKTNTYSQLDRLLVGTSLQDRSSTSYVEPPVSWNRPNTHYILDEDSIQRLTDFILTFTDRAPRPTNSLGLDLNSNPLTYSYANALEMFANPELTAALDIKKSDGQFLDTLNELVKREELLYTKFIAREIVFPRHRHVGLQKTRARTMFDNYKIFWKDRYLDRIKCVNETKLGYKVTDEFFALFKQRYSVDILDNFYYIKEPRSNSPYYQSAYGKVDFNSNNPAKYDGHTIEIEDILGLKKTYIFDNTSLLPPATGDLQPDTNYVIVQLNGLGSAADIATQFMTAVNSPNGHSNTTINASILVSTEVTLTHYLTDTPFAGHTRIIASVGTDAVTTTLAIEQFAFGAEQYKVLGDLTYIGEDRMTHMITKRDVEPLHVQPWVSSYISVEELCDVNTPTVPPNTPIYSSEEITRQKRSPIPSPQLYHTPYGEEYRESEGWLNRKVIKDSPTYDNYYDFSQDIKLASQNYGIIPEFRISEHMDKYILEEGGNFLAKNYDFLTLDGASHDGTTHTQTSGKIEASYSVPYYSIYSEVNEEKVVSAYPISSVDSSPIKNNADGFSEFNSIYSPTNSDYGLENGIGTGVEIKATSLPGAASIPPPIQGESFAGIFNTVSGENDFLVIDVDKVTTGQLKEGFSLSPTAERGSEPFTVSIWAQPQSPVVSGDSHGIYCFGDTYNSINIFSNYHYSDGHQPDLGLTFAHHNGNVNDSLPDFLGSAVDNNSTVYTFFKKDGTKAELIPAQMNHVVFQLIPPDAAAKTELNYLIKMWLNGEELYGVHIRELESSTYTARSSNSGAGIRGYSPCPIGEFQPTHATLGTDYPWTEDYDSNWTAADNTLRSMSTVNNFVIGNCDYLSSVGNGPSDKRHPFVGVLDEFSVVRGILPAQSISLLYNGGQPNNLNELVANNQLVGSLLYWNQGFIFNWPLPPSPFPYQVDNGEFDLGSSYGNNFEATANDSLPSGWTTNDATIAGPRVKEKTDSSNKILALIGNHSPTVDPDYPDGADNGNYRWVQLDTTFAHPITVSFKAYEGTGAGDPYGIDNPPESAQGEHLWLQYKVGAAGTWTNAGDPIQAGNGNDAIRPYWDLSQTVTREIDAGQNSINQLYLRWISMTTYGPTTDDHWGVDDISINEAGVIDIVSRSNDRWVRGSDFDDNYSVTDQTNITASLPIWHRIGVPQYIKETFRPSWDKDFFDSYAHTDNIEYIDKTYQKNAELGLANTGDNSVKLKLNIMKKLLPYDGFYPQDRTVQIVKLFTEKVKEDMLPSGPYTPDGAQVYKEQAMQAALQHFFAPGILYNSIKSGIACDWAAYTNKTGLEPSYFGDSVQVYDSTSGTPSNKYLKNPVPHWYSTSGLMPPIASVNESTYFRISDTTPIEITDDTTGELQHHSILNSGSGRDEVPFLSITSVPTERLPFEAILRPYEFLKGIDDGEKYEPTTEGSTPGTPAGYKVERKPYQYYLMTPTYYKDIMSFNTGPTPDASGSYESYNYPYFSLLKENRDYRYEMAISNFLAEATKFFIKDERLTSFVSAPEEDFKAFTSGTTYYMDVTIRKSNNFFPVNSPGSDLGGRYFGPPVAWMSETYSSEHRLWDPAYAPYVPPYFYAPTTARISFTATSAKHTLRDIFAASQIEDISDKTSEYFINKANLATQLDISGALQDPTDGAYEDFPSFKSKMPMSSSIELKGKTKIMKTTYGPAGFTEQLTTPEDSDKDTWVIYPKFECPVFSFSGDLNSSSPQGLAQYGISDDILESETKKTESFNHYAMHLRKDNYNTFAVDGRTGSGIWSGIGTSIDGGIRMTLGDSPNIPAEAGSLLDQCGFEKSTKNVGTVADQKVITEAIVMIPFYERAHDGFRFPQARSLVEVDDRYFIRVDKGEYDRQKGILEGSPEDFTPTSITDMIQAMKKYNIPPRYNFETYSHISPFAMYFFEFEHTLDKQDLENIWQGLPPKIAKQALPDSVEISHPINSGEFFAEFGKMPKDLRWLIFKVKRKAEKSYYKMTEDSRDDAKFKFEFDIGTKEPEYGYNYPYDYFTMIEMVQVETNATSEVDPLRAQRFARPDDGEE